MTKPDRYANWQAIKQRCLNPNNKSYPRYGGRGITVCDRWANSFAAFCEDIGPRPSPKHTVDRINNSLGYSPENCRWATPEQQMNNTRSNRILNIDGVSMTLSEAGRNNKLPCRTHLVAQRIHGGWSVEDAASTPRLDTRGEGSNLAKLTESEVEAIRQSCTSGTSQRRIARLFNVSQPTVSRIVNKKTWAASPIRACIDRR